MNPAKDIPEGLSASDLLDAGADSARQQFLQLLKNEGVFQSILEVQKSESPFPYPKASTWLRDMGCETAAMYLGKRVRLDSRVLELPIHWREAGSPELEWQELFDLREQIASDQVFGDVYSLASNKALSDSHEI